MELAVNLKIDRTYDLWPPIENMENVELQLEKKSCQRFNLDNRATSNWVYSATTIMLNNLWFFEFQHKFIHKTEFDVPSCWCGVSSSSHRYVVIVDLRSKLFDQMSISLTLGICLCNFCFRSSAFLLALSLFGPLFKLLHMCVRERARMWAFIYVSYTLTKWREKKKHF